ncbi:TPA: sigma-70 family RNA polymerase sigma factor [Bacillus mobilis]|uniref:sigma-70 family RNA polymerase sigma factor n=1 Tax=Bacillus mobilis TaxID=2026190 RepID=UPI0011AA51DC|nr:sigma-70 family RNA polymerase sigma factor [Bacillus mobilis]HDX9641470.1 sigma-70 family RNA polymerase sigma factor [Bacillus mobilis]
MICLKDYQELEQDILYLEYRLEMSKNELRRQSYQDKDILLIAPGNAKTEEILDQLKKELTYKKEQLQQLVNVVDKFKNVEHKILKLKYIDGMKLDSIAEELKYSPSYIKQKHAEIMRRIKFVEELKSGG